MKLSTKLLLISSTFLLLLPASAYYFISKLETTILETQQEAQSMTAAALATVVQGYTDLFDIDEDALYVYPLKQNMTIDGYLGKDEDWTYLKDKFSQFSSDTGDYGFSLLLVADKQYLYAFLKITDSNIVYRNPRYIALDSSDHIRLEYLDENNQRQRLVILAEGQGRMSVYSVNENWRTWTTGRHLNALNAVWHETATGYDVEFRLPVEWLADKERLSISVASVFNENERNLESLVSTKVLSGDLLNPVLLRSSEINTAIKNLGESDSQICVVDKYRRVRAVIGGNSMLNAPCQATNEVSQHLIDAALHKIEQNTDDSSANDLLIAVHPVMHDDDIVGAVLVSSSRQQILAHQRQTLLTVLLSSLFLFFLIIFTLLVFSTRLAFRINRLKKQTASLIDDSGRFINSVSLLDCKDGDEIGDLSRSFSLLLDKLNRYTCFLETVPRMLRHEILNPVNTISMSLQSLQADQLSGEEISKLRTGQNIKLACDAINQLQLIVSSLTEAANIDEILAQDEKQLIDIAALLNEYVSNTRRKHNTERIIYDGAVQGVYVLANDIRIVQLLDKIKDNALDFSLAETEICLQLDVRQNQQLIIRVKNEGETIPQHRLQNLFNGMVSHRQQKTEAPHLGIGLYVSFQIARFHQGELRVANRRDKQGVEVSLLLPQVFKY